MIKKMNGKEGCRNLGVRIENEIWEKFQLISASETEKTGLTFSTSQLMRKLIIDGYVRIVK